MADDDDVDEFDADDLLALLDDDDEEEEEEAEEPNRSLAVSKLERPLLLPLLLASTLEGAARLSLLFPFSLGDFDPAVTTDSSSGNAGFMDDLRILSPLLGSGTRLTIQPARLERAEKASRDEDEDDVVPLFAFTLLSSGGDDAPSAVEDCFRLSLSSELPGSMLMIVEVPLAAISRRSMLLPIALLTSCHPNGIEGSFEPDPEDSDDVGASLLVFSDWLLFFGLGSADRPDPPLIAQ